MDKKNILLIAIAILVVILIALGAYIITSNSDNGSINDNATLTNTTDNITDNTTDAIIIDKDGNVVNDTIVGDNSPRNDTNTSNETHRVYDPQTDSYVTVVGEAYDAEVDRWYTYDSDGVRYYNTRIK
jgi:FtsZ-interacting cell division protein ZipA